MRRVLITGFGAFSTHATNPTEALVRTWSDVMEVHDPWSDQSEMVHVEARVLTVDEAGAAETALRLQEGESWDAILHLGLCGSCSNARLEWLGRDAYQMREPDNAGRRVADAPITGAGDLSLRVWTACGLGLRHAILMQRGRTMPAVTCATKPSIGPSLHVCP